MKFSGTQKTTGRYGLGMMVWGILMMLLPSLASAQLFDSSDKPNDVSKTQFLDKMFGGLTGSGSDPLLSLFETFNTGVLVIGGILVFYTIIAGTLSTAHDGEMLGKRWSSLWIPIRTTLGAAAILPSIKGSYCLIQAVVMWLALQGVGLANKMWDGFLDNSGDIMMTAAYQPPGAARQIRNVIHDMFMSNVCMEGYRKAQGLTGGAMTYLGINPVEPGVTQFAGGYIYGPMDYCGSAMLPEQTMSADNSVIPEPFANDRTRGAPASASALISEDALRIALRPVHEANFAAIQAEAYAMAQQLVALDQLDQPEYDRRVQALVDNYTSQLRTAAINEYEAKKEAIKQSLIDGMKRDGWALAGMYYMAITRAQDVVTRAVTQTPSVSSGVMVGSESFIVNAATMGPGAAVGAEIRNAFTNSGESGKQIDRARILVQRHSAASLTQLESIADDATGRSWVMKVVSWFMNDDMVGGSGILAGGNSAFAQQGQNPVIMAKNLGENITAGAWAAFGIGGTVLAITGVSAIGTDIGDWATVFTPLLFAIFSTLIVPGAILSTYVPMIPYILWVGVMIGWVILVIEAVIAAPIWAVAHMAPDGDGVVGRGGQGYMLVLSLTLRPALMIFGLACSIALMQPVGYFVNSTFLGAFAIGVNPGPLALTQMIAGCILYCVFMVIILHRVFALIHVVPDRILRWIGGGGNELGQEAGALEQGTSAKILGGMAAMNQVGNLTQGVGQGVRDLNKRKADKANAESIRKAEVGSQHAQIEANVDDKAYRAGQEAHMAGAAADAAPPERQNPSSPEYQAAAASYAHARDARLEQGNVEAGNMMSQAGQDPNAFDQMSPSQQSAAIQQATDQGQAMLASAMQYRSDYAQAKSSGTMGALAQNQEAAARSQGSNAHKWTQSSGKAGQFEAGRQRYS